MEKLTKGKEEYLFKVCKRTLEWAEVDYTQEELANLVMQELIEIKE